MSDWIEWKWTPEKPYPETLETQMFLRFRDGEECLGYVKTWFNDEDEVLNHFKPHEDGPDDIVAYKVVK